MKRSPIKRRRRTKHQERNAEHREYVAWIHTQPCAACGTRQNIQAAHVGQGGTGLKHGDDDQAIPLCIVCHQDQEQSRGQFKRPAWADKYTWRAFVADWYAVQIAAHRGRFEARNVAAQGAVPF